MDIVFYGTIKLEMEFRSNQHSFSIDFSFLVVRYCAKCLWNPYP